MNKHITTSQFIEQLSEQVDLSDKQLKQFILNLFDIITRELKNSENFSIFGFGTFKKLFVAETTGHNPRTGEPITIKEHYRIKFTPSASVAKRINAGYEHLSPIIIDDTNPEHKSLLEKAESYSYNEDIKQENPAEKNTKSQFSVKKKKFKTKILIILLILILLFLLLFKILKNTSSKKDLEENKHLQTLNSSNKIESPQKALQIESLPIKGIEYSVKKGDTFSKISEKNWGSMSLWPYLYNLNKDNYSDPDILLPENTIIIPTKPDISQDKTEIQQSILIAYQKYKNLIKTQKYNSRNNNRKNCIVKVLYGAEMLYPGFLDLYKNEIDIVDIKTVKSIIQL